MVENGWTHLYTPLCVYLDSEAKTFHLALYSSILRLNVSYEATVDNVTFYLRLFSYMSVLPFRNEN
jgi:hypothetical protein